MKKIIKENRLHIALALLYHFIFVLVTVYRMDDECEIPIKAALICGGLYFIYWVIAGWKSYVNWIVYAAFALGTAVQLMLNLTGIVPSDENWIFSGIGKLFYEVEIVAIAVVIGITNLIMYGIWKLRNRKAK